MDHIHQDIEESEESESIFVLQSGRLWVWINKDWGYSAGMCFFIIRCVMTVIVSGNAPVATNAFFVQ